MLKFNMALLERKANIIKGIANPYRLAIINTLHNAGDKGKTVNELLNDVGGEQSNISRHLSIMRSADVLVAQKEGLHIYYTVKHPNIFKIVDLVDEVLNDLVDELSKLTSGAKSKSKK